MKTNFYLDKGNIVAEVNHSPTIKQKRFGLNVSVSHQYWDMDKKRVRNDARAPYARTTNLLLDKFSAVVKDYYNICVTHNLVISTDALSEHVDKYFFADNRKKKNSFLDYLDTYIDFKKKNDFAESTVKTFISLKNTMLDYCKFYKVSNLSFEMIDENFYEALEVFFIKRDDKKAREKKHNTFAKWVRNVKTVMNQAVKDGLTRSSEYNKKKIQEVLADKVSLTDDELDKLWSVKLDPRKSLIRDAYLIYCHISLRYGDGQRLEKDKHYFKDGDSYFIDMMPDKTKKHAKRTSLKIPSKVVALLEKYNWRIPQISNPTFNKEIKEICRIAGITDTIHYTDNIEMQNVEASSEKCDLITVHTSRATFITRCLMNGIPDKAISKMVGINVKTLEHYDKTKAKDFALKYKDNPIFK